MRELLDEKLTPIICASCETPLTTENVGESIFGITCRRCLAKVNAAFRAHREILRER